MAPSPLPQPPRWTYAETGLWAWRSPRLFALVLVAVAVILGAQLRLYRLARLDMSADEGASWAGASAPDIRQVVAMEQQLDPGKLAIYDVLLHEWIGVFGDSLFAMRAMSAALGTIAIVLVFVAVRGVCRSLGEDGSAASMGELAGAFAALLYAVNLRMVVSDRTVRMYPLMMVAALLQVTFFARAQRRGTFLNYAGTAILTAVMVATNFTSSFLLIAEALWLEGLLLARDAGARVSGLKALGAAVALMAGIVLLLPWWPAVFASSQHAVQAGFINWIGAKPISWPYTTLRIEAGGNKLFWTLAVLSAFGVWQQWSSARLALAFFLLWTAGPMLVVMAITYLKHPMESPRYVIISFVGLFALAGVGASSVRSTALRLALVVLFIHLTVHPAHKWLRHSREIAWREAATVAIEKTAPGETISVVPSYAVNVVRYYLPRDQRDAAVGVDFGCGSSRVLILNVPRWMPADQSTRMVSCYPRIVQSLFRAEVRAR